ncbi:MAG: polymerase sigma factor SigW [Bacilli bacterium]|nr:polymerase sigma factor SigW [Bacilli bacterium]
MDFLESQIVRRVQSGDRLAFAELVELYKNRLFNLAHRMLGNKQDAEDVLQDTFLRAYANLASYNDHHKFSTWIYRIATNACIDRLRKRKADVSLDAEQEDAEGTDLYSRIASLGLTPEEEALHSETASELEQAIERLPASYRSVILLKYVHDLSLQEIADILQLPVSTIKTRIHRGREALRASLQQAKRVTSPGSH